MDAPLTVWYGDECGDAIESADKGHVIWEPRGLVEQDVHSAFQVADRAYVMKSGHIVREGKSSELADDPEVIRAYLGV